jgi:hypothetical protein
MKMLLGDFTAKLFREVGYKIIGNESLHEISSGNGIRIIKFATTKNLTIKRTMFPHCTIHKYTWMSLNGKTYNQIDHILIDRQGHSRIFDVQSSGQQTVIPTTIWYWQKLDRD